MAYKGAGQALAAPLQHGPATQFSMLQVAGITNHLATPCNVALRHASVVTTE